MKLLFKGSINDKKREIYEKACKSIEMSSKYIYNGYIKALLPLSTVPYLIMSYFKYYTTDLEKDAFILPFITWYVMTDYYHVRFLIDIRIFKGQYLIGEHQRHT